MHATWPYGYSNRIKITSLSKSQQAYFMKSRLMKTYSRLPVNFSHGQGSYLYDSKGRSYLDGLCGISVTNLGHAHPAVTLAIKKQAESLLHTSNLYEIDGQELLASQLADIAGMDKIFFANSGAEANEAAIKLARMHGHQRGFKNPEIIVLEGAFHGRTLATLSATDGNKIQTGFAPLVPGFIRTKRNDFNEIVEKLESHSEVVAILLEPIQGEGGIIPLNMNYLKQLRELCDEKNCLLIFDEVQSGNGRTGNYFAYQGLGVVPDIVTTAKGLANGVPIGACLAKGSAAEVLTIGKHGSTFGGNPLACAAAMAVLETIKNEELCSRSTELGKIIRDSIVNSVNDLGLIKEIRGKGLMIGVELNNECNDLVSYALNDGLLINVTSEKTIRLLPPLIMTDEEGLALGRAVGTAINNFQTLIEDF